MLERSEAYKAAITGDARRILLKAVVSIIDPDIELGEPSGSPQANFARPEQIQNFVFAPDAEYATLERNRWILGAGQPLLPNIPAEAEVGAVSAAVSGDDGNFAEPQYIRQNFTGVSVLQACSVFFPDVETDGVAADFTVEVLQGGTAYHTETFTGNTESAVYLKGFTVYDPDAICVTVTRWSLPGRRMRVAEIIPGIYEEWDSGMVASFDVQQQADFSCLSLPYGTCTLRMDNLDRRFEPRNKEGLFKSIEERQGIDVSVGVRTEDGAEFKKLGVFYQYSGGWRTGDNGLTMQWDLADIVGLLTKRTFVLPAVLPTVLAGWIAALAAQLGSSFAEKWHVDPDYANLPVTVNDRADLEDVTCGDVLRWVCMATGTWPRADAETGYLTAEPFWHEGNRLDLDNMTIYPIMRANNDLAAIIFTLFDGNDTQYIVSGNATASSDTVSVRNPFIHNESAALTAARMILSTYGGNQLETLSRGDPASEIGDVDTVWLNESSATTGRRMLQDFRMQNGVLQSCRSVLLQADGAFLFQERAVLTGSGEWTAPAGVDTLRVILVGRGEDGATGEDGSWEAAGEPGADGAGAKVWAATININSQQVFPYDCGAETVFGAYSSADGKRYPNGYTDVASGDSFARMGVEKPMDGSGDGGAGGRGGVRGNRHWETQKDFTVGGRLPPENSTVYIPVEVLVVDNEPGKGAEGAKGAKGCVVVYWDKGAEV